jgi:hypothetical protein
MYRLHPSRLHFSVDGSTSESANKEKVILGIDWKPGYGLMLAAFGKEAESLLAAEAPRPYLSAGRGVVFNRLARLFLLGGKTLCVSFSL